MKPLVVHETAAAVLFWACVGAWFAGEMAFMRRTTGADEGGSRTRGLLTLAVLAGQALAVLAAFKADSLTLPGPGWWPLAAGLALLAAGLAYRIWAIRTLGRFFKYEVVVQEGHEVVQSGPYRRVRHPAYTGMIAASAGAGLALGNWLSIALAGGFALAAFGARLVSEERILAEELGAPYREYMTRTHRLIPGVW